MDKQRQEEIIKILNSKDAIQPCPRCHNPQFELVGESAIQLSPQSSGSPFGPPIIPVILIACKNCGYITHHAERILDPNAPLKFSR